jgi:triphosphatase
MEIEIKLLCDATAVPAIADHKWLQQLSESTPKQSRITSVYFDTPEFFLRQHGLGLRVRKIGRKWVQTLKGGGSVASGLHRREEWELPLAGKHPDLSALQSLVGAKSRQGKLLGTPKLAEQLVPIFTTEFKRIAWPLRLPNGQKIECALDLGKITQGTKTELISEVELELKSGDACGLFELAQQLMATFSFRLGHVSKAARGYALCDPVSVIPVVNATDVNLAPDILVAQAGRRIFESCFDHIHGNETGVTHGRALESVHQMRVGLRRLRSALGLFGKTAHFPEALIDELRWITSELGGSRDWEILAFETLEIVAAVFPAGEHAAVDIGALQKAAIAMATEQRHRASAAVQSERYAKMALALGGWQHCDKWFSAVLSTETEVRQDLDAPLKEWVKPRLTALFFKLVKRAKSLSESTSEQRHRARIAAKKLRYATEFFRTLYPKRETSEFLSKLKELQAALGWLNDAAVADAHLESLAGRTPELAASAQFVRGWLAGRADKDVEVLAKAWKHFRSASLPWKT